LFITLYAIVKEQKIVVSQFPTFGLGRQIANQQTVILRIYGGVPFDALAGRRLLRAFAAANGRAWIRTRDLILIRDAL
tara:strand:- start:393 stop:626 length:234 start_codon:yes stop_codon:yes gene_type:complete